MNWLLNLFYFALLCIYCFIHHKHLRQHPGIEGVTCGDSTNTCMREEGRKEEKGREREGRLTFSRPASRPVPEPSAPLEPSSIFDTEVTSSCHRHRLCRSDPVCPRTSLPSSGFCPRHQTSGERSVHREELAVQEDPAAQLSRFWGL